VILRVARLYLANKLKWRMPTKSELDEEFKEPEIREVLLEGDPVGVKSIEDVHSLPLKVVRGLTVGDLSSENAYRFKFSDLDSLRVQVSRYGAPRDVDRVVAGIQAGVTLPMPLLLKRKNELLLVGGATRVAVCGIMGLPFDAVVLDARDVYRHKAEFVYKEYLSELSHLGVEMDQSIIDKIEAGQRVDDTDIEDPSLAYAILLYAKYVRLKRIVA